MFRQQQFTWIMLTLLLLTSACAGNTKSEPPIVTSSGQMMTILFSNEQSLRDEADFYDALLELQQSFPDESVPLQIIYSNEKEKVKHFKVAQYPTLIVLEGHEVKLRMEGLHEKEEIMRMLKNTLQVQSSLDKNETD